MKRPAIETFASRYIEQSRHPRLSADVYNEIKALYSAERNPTRLYYRICRAFTQDGTPVLSSQVDEVFTSIHKRFSDVPAYMSGLDNPAKFEATCLANGLKARTFESRRSAISYYSLMEDALDALVSIGYIEKFTFTGFATIGKGRAFWNWGVRYGHSARATIVRVAR